MVYTVSCGLKSVFPCRRRVWVVYFARPEIKRRDKREVGNKMLTLENLSFDVNDEKGEIGIIKDISFTVDDGKFVVITGPNGGGKSTTAKLIMGIERPTGGRILFDGPVSYTHLRAHET